MAPRQLNIMREQRSCESPVAVPTPVRPPPLETVRAEPLAEREPLSVTKAPSSHPTSKPDMDLALLAEAGRDFTPSVAANVLTERFPMEMAVPVCTSRCTASGIGHRVAFVLMHVDGTTAIISIAKMVGLPLGEVIACFEELVEAGLVELVVPGQPVPAGKSGVFSKLDPLPADVGLTGTDSEG